MVIFSPRLFFLTALLLSSIYLLAAKSRDALQVPPKAVDWVVARLDESTQTVAGLALNGSPEYAKARSNREMSDLHDAMGEAPAPGSVNELTVQDLVRTMELALASVPRGLPNLPLMVGLVHSFLRYDPQGIQFAPLPRGVLGEFDPRNPMHPKIVLSSRLQDLHRRGVPTRDILSVLVHEVDHMLVFLLISRKPRTLHQDEYSAFRSEGYFLSSFHHDGDDDAPVDASDIDPEKKAYYDDLKRIRRGLFGGQLPQLIKATYGPDMPVGRQN